MCNKNDYYDMNDLDSFNAPITMVMGERGNGKTFKATKKMFKKFIKEGKESMYVRRTKTELLQVVDDNLFDDVINAHYPQYKGRVKLTGNEAKGFIYTIDDKPFVYCLALKSSGQIKGKKFPNVDYIFMDEYIPMDLKFCKDEYLLIENLLSTVFRDRENWRCHFASNSVSYVCPLLEAMELTPNPTKRFHKVKVDGKLIFVLELTDTKQYQKRMLKSTLGLLAKKGGHDGHLFSNEVLLDSDLYINKNKPNGCDTYVCGFNVDNKKYGVWTNANKNYCYIDYSFVPHAFNNPMFSRNFYIYNKDMIENTCHVKEAKTNRLEFVSKMFKFKKIEFKNQSIKRKFMDEIYQYIK